MQGIPFVLRRVPKMISTPSENKRVRREKWLLHIEANEQWVQHQLGSMQRQALNMVSSDIALLPNGDEVQSLCF